MNNIKENEFEIQYYLSLYKDMEKNDFIFIKFTHQHNLIFFVKKELVKKIKDNNRSVVEINMYEFIQTYKKTIIIDYKHIEKKAIEREEDLKKYKEVIFQHYVDFYKQNPKWRKNLLNIWFTLPPEYSFGFKDEDLKEKNALSLLSFFKNVSSSWQETKKAILDLPISTFSIWVCNIFTVGKVIDYYQIDEKEKDEILIEFCKKRKKQIESRGSVFVNNLLNYYNFDKKKILPYTQFLNCVFHYYENDYDCQFMDEKNQETTNIMIDLKEAQKKLNFNGWDLRKYQLFFLHISYEFQKCLNLDKCFIKKEKNILYITFIHKNSVFNKDFFKEYTKSFINLIKTKEAEDNTVDLFNLSVQNQFFTNWLNSCVLKEKLNDTCKNLKEKERWNKKNKL